MGLAASKQEAFWEACGFGHTERVRRFIADGIDVNWVSYTHNSCAIHVASQGKPEIVKMLLDQNCNVNARDDRENTALHHAAMKGHTEVMEMLINAGVEINAQDKNGWTALINAAYWCHPEAIKLLIRRSCNVHLENKDERNALHEACRSPSKDEEGLTTIASLMVEAKCDMDSKSSDVGEADFTPLMFASYHGHAGIAKVLIDAGCDIDAQGSNGWSALHWAADRGHADVTQVLIEGGICPVLLGRREELAIDRTSDPDIRRMIADAIERYKRSQVVDTDDDLDEDDSDEDGEPDPDKDQDEASGDGEKESDKDKGDCDKTVDDKPGDTVDILNKGDVLKDNINDGADNKNEETVESVTKDINKVSV